MSYAAIGSGQLYLNTILWSLKYELTLRLAAFGNVLSISLLLPMMVCRSEHDGQLMNIVYRSETVAKPSEFCRARKCAFSVSHHGRVTHDTVILTCVGTFCFSRDAGKNICPDHLESTCPAVYMCEVAFKVRS